MIYVRELTPADADTVARMEARYHDSALTDTPDVHRQRLVDALAERANLSFGVFISHRMVGYVLCYGLEPSVVDDEDGMAIYIEDIVIEPTERKLLAQLLRRFMREVRTHFPTVPVEAHSAKSGIEIWRRHDAWIRREGFVLAREIGTNEVVGGETRYILRWEPLITAVPEKLEQILKRLPTYPVGVNGRSYAVKLIQRESHWEALESLWDSLLTEIPGHTVFQSYAYQRLWWKHFGGDAEIFILLILRDTQVVGIAPLQTRVSKHILRRYRRKLGFIGSRWEVDRPQLLFPKNPTELIHVLVRFLVERYRNWDRASFYEQVTDSVSARALVDAFRARGFLIGETRDSTCPFLRLSGNWNEFLAGKSRKFRKNLGAAHRRLSDAGVMRYDVYESPDDVCEQLDCYRDIESRSWKAEERAGRVRTDDYYAFCQELARVFGSAGSFVVRTLSVGGRAIAGTFGLVFDGAYYSLQIAHDVEFNRCSPGTYLEALEIQSCFERGYREYDFLGGFLNNKSRWTTTNRYTSQLEVYRRTPLLVLVHGIKYRIKPRVKAFVRLNGWSPKRSRPRR